MANKYAGAGNNNYYQSGKYQNYGQSYEQNYSQGYNQGYNQKYSQNYGQSFNKVDSSTEEANAVQAMKYIQDSYPNISNINFSNVGYSLKVKEQQAARFYVIKSFTEEDIHKVR